MISREKYFLTVLGEEASEIAQVASKAIRFGLDNVSPYNGLTNKKSIIQEVNDLMAIIWELNDVYGLEFSLDRQHQENKRLKVSEQHKKLFGGGSPSPIPTPPPKKNKMTVKETINTDLQSKQVA